MQNNLAAAENIGEDDPQPGEETVKPVLQQRIKIQPSLNIRVERKASGLPLNSPPQPAGSAPTPIQANPLKAPASRHTPPVASPVTPAPLQQPVRPTDAQPVVNKALSDPTAIQKAAPVLTSKASPTTPEPPVLPAVQPISEQGSPARCGQTISELVSRAAFNFRDFRQTVEGILEALMTIHSQSEIHGHITPDKVVCHHREDGSYSVELLAPDPENKRDPNDLTNLKFTAPEQFNKKPVNPRSDLYSAGCLFYYMLTGKYPFEGDAVADIQRAHETNTVRHVSQSRHDLPSTFGDWVMWHVNTSQGNRPGSAKVSLENFRTLHASLRSQTMPIPTKVPAFRKITEDDEIDSETRSNIMKAGRFARKLLARKRKK